MAWLSGRAKVILLHVKIQLVFVSHSLGTSARLWIYYLYIWSNLNFAQLPVDHLTHPVVSSLIHFCANFLHPLNMWLIVSSLSRHNQHFLFSCVLSILSLLWLVLIAFFCAAIMRVSVSSIRFPFLRHVHVLSCEMFLISRLKRP